MCHSSQAAVTLCRQPSKLEPRHASVGCTRFCMEWKLVMGWKPYQTETLLFQLAQCLRRRKGRFVSVSQERLMSADEISLRPLSLRPGGKNANPFAGFGKGAGFAVKKQVCVVCRHPGRPTLADRRNPFLLFRFSRRLPSMKTSPKNPLAKSSDMIGNFC